MSPTPPPAAAPGPSARDRMRDACARHYRAGASLAEVAAAAGCSFGTARRLVLEAGLTLRARGGARDRSRGARPTPAGVG